jgi:hypothetical protein
LTRFYFDENAADDARVAAARRLGLDVLTPNEVGMLRRTDDEQLQFAASHDRALITEDSGDFIRIHYEWLAAGREHAGIVVNKQQDHLGPGEFARRLQILATGELRSDLAYLHNVAS